MVYIQNSSEKGERVNLNQIAEAIDSPVAFTSKILQQLKKKGLLVSIAGVSGGFNIPMGKEITLKQIVVAIDGNEMFISCVLGLNKCNADNPCPLHNLFATERNKMNDYLANSFLKELSDNFELKKISLK
jgi:Rrf2 family protein